MEMEYGDVVLAGALLLVLALLLALLASSRPSAPPAEDEWGLDTDGRERAADATRYANGDPGDEPPDDKFP
jgi:hypothetical protein